MLARVLYISRVLNVLHGSYIHRQPPSPNPHDGPPLWCPKCRSGVRAGVQDLLKCLIEVSRSVRDLFTEEHSHTGKSLYQSGTTPSVQEMGVSTRSLLVDSHVDDVQTEAVHRAHTGAAGCCATSFGSTASIGENFTPDRGQIVDPLRSCCGRQSSTSLVARGGMWRE